jgi:hypothetical protein
MARPLHNSPLADVPRWMRWMAGIGIVGTAAIVLFLAALLVVVVLSL